MWKRLAPVYLLRLKAAAERGAKLIVANARETKMDRYAAISIRYQPGADAQTVYGLLASNQQSAARSDECQRSSCEVRVIG